MKIKILVLAAVSLLSTKAWAQEGLRTKAGVQKQLKVSPEQSSSEHGVEKSRGIYGAAGFSYPVLFGWGGIIKFTRKVEMDLEFLQGYAQELTAPQSSEEIRVTRSTVRGRFSPMGGSFNFSVGVSSVFEKVYRKETGLFTTVSALGTSGTTTDYKHEYSSRLLQFQGDLAVGNRWTIADRLLLGVDWFGMSERLVKVSHIASFKSDVGALSEKEQEDFKQQTDARSRISFVLCKLQVGVRL